MGLCIHPFRVVSDSLPHTYRKNHVSQLNMFSFAWSRCVHPLRHFVGCVCSVRVFLPCRLLADGVLVVAWVLLSQRLRRQWAKETLANTVLLSCLAAGCMLSKIISTCSADNALTRPSARSRTFPTPHPHPHPYKYLHPNPHRRLHLLTEVQIRTPTHTPDTHAGTRTHTCSMVGKLSARMRQCYNGIPRFA